MRSSDSGERILGLAEYKHKRHFDRTPEPAGKKTRKQGWSYVIQKHAASHLHYDFRLELDGVFKSWAVPKGPSLDPNVKRLAMHVEDHPVEYGSFEGTIPEGEYGAGTVMLWDRGKWKPVDDPHEGYESGRLKFKLLGKKLHGGWMLVRTSRGKSERDQRQWLLFKERDDEARPSDEGDVLDEMPDSVKTGRSMDQIAKRSRKVWSSKPHSNGRPRTPTTRRKLRTKSKLTEPEEQQIDGFRLTSPKKVLYPEQGITKLDLAHYYQTAAKWILPNLEDRPLVLVRCPEGRSGSCFYQKHPGAGTPDALRRISVREKNKTEDYAVVDDEAGLLALAQIGALEIHSWGSRADRIEQPDRITFDLDPAPDVPWSQVIQGAHQVRRFLQELGLESFVKTTGGKGLHLVVPIARRLEWDDVKDFCKQVADLVVAADPAHYTANMSKAARHGKIFIDYLRNGRGASAIVAYSTRAKPNAPISTPITWKELTPQLRSDHFNIRNIGGRLKSLRSDPWAEIASLRQELGKPLKKIQSLVKGG